MILQIGPNVLYRSKHIPGAGYAGPASKPDGLELLKVTVAKLPRDREIVLYCGCLVRGTAAPTSVPPSRH